MSEIKEGALVKAWDDGDDGFVICYFCYKLGVNGFIVDVNGFTFVVDNVFKIPPELAAQLEVLGVE